MPSKPREPGRFLPLILLALVSGQGAAQVFDHEWAVFEPDPSLIVTSLPAISSPDDEVDLAQGDLDLDGWVDVVVVRKEPWTTPGKRTNVLLMNEGGVLVDRTLEYASAADVVGDAGFLTPTNDRDVGIADLDGDGWPEVVTVTTLQVVGEAKALGYPRVYQNLGEDGGGNWLGLEYQEARMPQLLTIPAGTPGVAYFNAVAIGDVSGDGLPDLYLAHHDEGLVMITPPAGHDLDDRLLINDGNGYFVDETAVRMTAPMYETTFTSAVVVADFNGDLVNDIMRVETAGEPEIASVRYNDPGNEGSFLLFDDFHNDLEPYHVEQGDLDNDGRLDVVLGDDLEDRYRLNLGNDGLGRVIWGPSAKFDYLYGTDESYAGNIRIGDLDNDGWDEVLVCSVDVQSDLGTRRTHIYHNMGGLPGLTELVLREEREGQFVSEWIGAPGFDAVNMLESYDLLLIDVDADGWKDILHATFDGTTVFRNLTGEQVCQTDLGHGGTFGGEGALLTMCGGPMATGSDADLRVVGAPALGDGWLVLSTSNSPTPFAGGTLVPVPIVLLVPVRFDGEGVLQIRDIPGGGGPGTLYAQVVYEDATSPSGFGLTNALAVEIEP